MIGEVDIDRVVWDPDYRRRVMAFLRNEEPKARTRGDDRHAANDNTEPGAMSRSGASGGRTPPDH